MKKLLLLTLISSFSFVNAQVLQDENFNTLTVGNLSTDLTGAVLGQGDYYLQSINGAIPTTSTNSALTNAQIISDGNASLGLQLTGPNGDKGNRYIWKDGLADVWATRAAGNNIIEFEMDINPGAGTTTSRNTFGVYIFNTAGNVLAGFFVRAATRELFLVAYSTPTGNPVGNYNYTLAAAPGIQMPADTFSRIGVSYDTTTGQIRLKAPGIDPAGLTLAGSVPVASRTPNEIDVVSFSGHTTAIPNTSAASMVIDNITVRASATDTLLGTQQLSLADAFSVYPNPTKDIVNVSSYDYSINTIQITDMNGRIVKKVSNNSNETQISLSDLSQGVYLMKITSNEGVSTTKKIVKQ